jgi:hypothetical protein
MRSAIVGELAPEKAGSHMRSTSYLLAIMCASLMSSAAVSAQSVQPDWSHGTTLSAFAGGSVDGTQDGPAFGGSVGWEITPRFAVDGLGTWTEFGGGADAFAGAIRLRVRVAGHRSVDPFVQGGVGMYRAMFEHTANQVPEFYRRRIDPASPFGATFTDPALVTGGGVSIFLKRWFALRPEAEVTFVIRDGTHVVTNFLVHAVFHFEEHPVTPSVRR